MSTSQTPGNPTDAPSAERHGSNKLSERGGSKLSKTLRGSKTFVKSSALAVANIFAGVPKNGVAVDSSAQSKPENANGPYGSFWLSKCMLTLLSDNLASMTLLT